MPQFKKTIFFVITTILVFGCAGGKSQKSEKALAVNLESPVIYENGTGDQFIARYGSLSDNSLHFVKITMPDGQKYTLPQSVSGSGARYTDDMEIVWWEHHGTVRIDVRGPDGKWVTKYSGLKEIKKEK